MTFFGQNCATIHLLIYKIILEHQDKEINRIRDRGTNHVLFWHILETKMRELEKILAQFFFKLKSILTSPSMTRDTHALLLIQKCFLVFEMTLNPRDTSPLMRLRNFRETSRWTFALCTSHRRFLLTLHAHLTGLVVVQLLKNKRGSHGSHGYFVFFADMTHKSQ